MCCVDCRGGRGGRSGRRGGKGRRKGEEGRVTICSMVREDGREEAAECLIKSEVKEWSGVSHPLVAVLHG